MVRPGPAYSVQDVSNGWVKGLRSAGCEVVDFNFNDRLQFYAEARRPNGDKVLDPESAAVIAAKGIEVACYEFWPDVVLIVSGFFVPPATYDLLRARGHVVVLLHTESPYEDAKQALRATRAHVNIVNDPTNLASFPEHTHYFGHAYDPDLHSPGPPVPEYVCDLGLVGTGYPSRVRFLEACDLAGVDVKLGGNWQHTSLDRHLVHPPKECMDNADAVQLYRSAKASVNLYRIEGTGNTTHRGWSCTPREIELAATGTFFLRESRPESDDLFPMLPTFTGPADFSEQLRWWLTHDDDRAEAADKARAAVADRTFQASAERLLDLIPQPTTTS